MEKLLTDSFRYWRQRRLTAKDALAKARADAAANKARYPSSYINNGFTENKPFKAYGESSMRWVECPENIGLRKVGFADEVYDGIDHNGWYTRDDEYDELVRGIVYQFPGRDGKPRYVYGYADPYNTDNEGNGPACLSFDITDDKNDAARWADSIAESYAEEQRDYSRAWDAGQRFAELGEEVATARQACLALISEAKAACDKLAGLDTIKATIRESVSEYIGEIRRARKARAKLYDEFGNAAGFKDA